MLLNEAGRIAEWLEGTDIARLELSGPDGRVVLIRRGRSVALQREGAAVPAGTSVLAPAVGVFLHHHPLHEAPLARRGEFVACGQMLGLLGIGPLLLPVLAPVAGRVAEILAPHEAVVGFGTRLMELTHTATGPQQQADHAGSDNDGNRPER